MVQNIIMVGAHTFYGQDILELHTSRTSSLLLDEMATDACEAIVICEDGTLDLLAYGTKVSILRDFAVQDVFYLTSVTRIKTRQYKLNMTSFLGILDSEMYYGGYYTGQTFQSLVESIIQTNGLNPNTTDHADMLPLIEYDSGVASLPIYGWLQVSTKREALHQLLFSQGIAMKRSTGGVILFALLYDTESAAIPIDATYQDGDVTFLPNVSDIEVEEHAFTDDLSAEQVVLFENREQTVLGKTYVAVFNCDSPVLRPVTRSGLVILYQNCNAAIVTGVGSIKGYPSVHSTTMIKETIRQIKGETKSVKGCTLVTLANSAFIFDRFRNYYMTAETEVGAEIVRANEKPGSHVSVVNSFGERVDGYITGMNENYSGIIKAECKIITGYRPQERADGFNRYVLLTGSGAWTVPDSVYLKATPSIKVVLVGGGTGGNSGRAGSPGLKPEDTGQIASGYGPGGVGGSGGTGGKIHTVEITNPSRTLYFNCGAGGAGGAVNSNPNGSNAGSAGTDSTLTNGGSTISSASGSRKENGVVNLLTGVRYGMTRGGFLLSYLMSGGYGALSIGASQIEYPINIGYVVFDVNANPPSYRLEKYQAGDKGNDATGRYYPGSQNYYQGTVYGGGGGGGAAGTKGGKGGDAWAVWAEYMHQAGQGGKGGTGATPSISPPKPNRLLGADFLAWDDGAYGSGGIGGYGGGGGGSGGPSPRVSALPEYDKPFLPGDGGNAGNGGVGGAGGDGCILIYY